MLLAPIHRRTLLWSLGAGVVAIAAPSTAWGKKREEPPIPTLPLSIAVALDPGEEGAVPVCDEAWIDAQVAAAERLFGAHGVHFWRGDLRRLPATFAKLETREDRDALAAHLERGKINVFVVGSLRDVDEPERFRMGVHWRKRADLRKHYVIVAASAMPTTLSHELGHFFGNGHSTVVNNVMSYWRTGDDVFFDPAQVKKIRAFARIYLRTKELVPAP